MNNVNMANMGAMGGPVGAAAAMGMMNNGAVVPQGAPRQLPANDNTRTLLNTYIYEYFLRYGMFDCARAILSSDQQVKVQKDGSGSRRDENGNPLGNGLGDDSMDTDSKDDMDSKRPDDLPAPNVPMPLPDSCFLFEWFCLFWDMFNAQKGKGTHAAVSQYVAHTQQTQSRRQTQQQEMLRSMRPDFTAQQNHMHLMRNMQQNGAMMNMKPGNNLPRTAMANSQNNPQAMQMLQQKQGQMQRDPSDMDGNRQRPSSPGSTDNAPSPSKRPRLDGGGFNPNQGGMIPNGRPVGQAMPGQQVGTAGPPNQQQVQQMLLTHGINPATLNPDQLQTFTNQSPAVQAKTIATYAANLQQQQSNQLHNKPMPNATGPQTQGSPMIPQGPDGAALNAYYNAGELGGPAGMRPGPGGGQVAGGGSNHALQDYQMQLMLLEQQNKKRLMMARQEQDGMGLTRPDGGPPGPGGPGAPPGPNAQSFQGASPQGGRTGASPNPSEQIKRNNQQMGNAGIGSPIPENPQSRGSPNPMNFMGAGTHMDPGGAPNFFKGMGNMEGNMVAAAQMNGMRPPSSHPAQQQFNGQMNQQQMMAARQQQQQPGGGPQVQWQQAGANGNPMGPQGPQAQQVGTTPQQRTMGPPSAPAAANAGQRNQTASPQTTTAAPPTPQGSTKPNPKKKDTKNAKSKTATQKKSNSNLNAGATPAADAPAEAEAAAPATPITPVTNSSFPKAGQGAAVTATAANGQPAQAPAAPVSVAAPPPHADPNQNSFGLEGPGMGDFTLDFANPLTSNDVLTDFDFDTFLNENNDDPGAFDFGGASFGMEGAGEIGAD